MDEVFNLLTKSDIVKEYEILSLLEDEDFYYLKIKSDIINNTTLFIKIYLSDTEYNYSFHWQDEEGELIIRWDNAPHHQEIETYPHHKHTPLGIEKSYDITLNDVLNEIKKKKATGAPQ
jgi:hypothetical protein